MPTHYEQIPREVNGHLDLGTVYVWEGDEYRVTVSDRMRDLGIPNSRWMPVTPKMVGKLIGAETDPCIEVRRKFDTKQPRVASTVPNDTEAAHAQDRFEKIIMQQFARDHVTTIPLVTPATPRTR